MTDDAALPPSRLLRVQGTSRLAFGATTVALVTLASGGTAVLVESSTRGVGSPTSLPTGALPPDASPTAPSLVVGRPAGEQPVLEDPPASAPDDTERALRQALAQRPVPGRRTLTAPLVAVPPTAEVPELVPPALPPAVPPGSGPPVPGPVTSPPTRTPAADDGDDDGKDDGCDGDEPDASHGNHRAHPQPHAAHPKPHPKPQAHPSQASGRHAKAKPASRGRHAR